MWKLWKGFSEDRNCNTSTLTDFSQHNQFNILRGNPMHVSVHLIDKNWKKKSKMNLKFKRSSSQLYQSAGLKLHTSRRNICSDQSQRVEVIMSTIESVLRQFWKFQSKTVGDPMQYLWNANNNDSSTSSSSPGP